MNNETAAFRGKEIASLVRAYQWGGVRIEADEIWDAFERLMGGEAAAPSDALALLTVAQTLLAEPLVRIPAPDESTEGFALNCVLQLLEKATCALEKATGTDRDTFTGMTPALECPQ